MKLKQLKLRNFKGAQSVEISFSQGITDISGDNGTGKTTVFDAFNFLLWGKNSENETDFDIKTLDSKNKSNKDLEHEVIGVITHEGADIELRRVYKEKWVKKRGDDESQFSGNETLLFVNDVPKSAGEYKMFIDSIIPDKFARIITDPRFFNVHLKWEQRRAILQELAGEVSDQDILSENPQLDEIPSILLESKSLSDKKKEISAKKTKIKQEKEQIPARIDEVDRTKPAVKEWGLIESEIKDLEPSLARIEILIDSDQERINNAFKSQSENNTKRNELKLKIDEQTSYDFRLSNKGRSELINHKSGLEDDLSNNVGFIKRFESDFTGNNTQIEVLRQNVAELGEKYESVKSKQFVNLNQFDVDSCPTCNQPLPIEEIEIKHAELLENFNTQKVNDLNAISKQATEKNAEIQRLQAVNSGVQAKIDDLKAKELELQDQINKIVIPEVADTTESSELLALKQQLALIPETTTTEQSDETLKTQKKELTDQIQQLKDQLKDRDLIAKADERIEELKNQQKAQAQEIASLERIEMQIDQFTKIKMETVENRVNSMFELVKFKMFEQQINGGEQPTCVCLINGVPFSSLNKASQINAGLDVIYTLQKHYGVYAPVFIDNRESISVIRDMDCQIINLIKVEGLKILTVE